MATTFERVRVIVADRLGVDEDKVAMDSEFIGVQIKDEDAENIRTVSDAVQYIDEHSG